MLRLSGLTWRCQLATFTLQDYYRRPTCQVSTGWTWTWGSPEIEWADTGRRAELVNGKLYMMGGGWDRITAQALPWQQHMAVAVAIRVPWMDTNRQTSVEIDLTDEDGTSLGKVQGEFIVGRPAEAVPGQPLRSQIVLKADVAFPKVGSYAVVCRLHGSETSFPFNVAASPQLAAQVLNQGGGGPAKSQ